MCYEPSAINFHLGETPPRELWEREPTEFAATGLLFTGSCATKTCEALPSSLPGLTRQSIRFEKTFLRRMMDPRVISASTRVFDALLPAGDGTRFNRSLDDFSDVPNNRWRWGFPTRVARRECRPASARSRRGVGGSAKPCRRKSSPSPKGEGPSRHG
jgi:hypothetical protein